MPATNDIIVSFEFLNGNNYDIILALLSSNGDLISSVAVGESSSDYTGEYKAMTMLDDSIVAFVGRTRSMFHNFAPLNLISVAYFHHNA